MTILLKIMILVAALAAAASAVGATQLEGQFLAGTGATFRTSQTSAISDTIGQFVVGISADSTESLEHGFWHSNQSLFRGKRELPDGASVELNGLTVSAGTEYLGAAFYIEKQSVAGIKVAWAGGAVPTGSVVTIWGALQTDSDFERYISASYVGIIGSGEITPSAMSNKCVGGGDTRDYDPITGKGQRGVKDGVGLNNIGLLVRTLGTVTAVGSSFFYIDDGTNAQDDSVFGGIRVMCEGMAKPASGQYVSVTGISSILRIRDQTFRCVRPRNEDDISVQLP